jgi:putative ABC transport system permease protein
MNFRTLIRRSLRFHWRSHLGVVLGAAIGSAALIGALVVGDSVKGSLREQALHRLGGVSLAMSTGDRFITEGLYQRAKLWAEMQFTTPGLIAPSTNAPQITWKELASDFVRAPILQLPGSSWKIDGAGRANNVQLLGVDPAFFQVRSTNEPIVRAGEVWVNRALATQLQAKSGDTLLFRLAKPNALSQEVALVSRDEATTTLRLQVAGIAPAEWADFSLQTGPTLPLNAFLSRADLAKVVGLNGRINLFVTGEPVQSKPVGWLATTGQKLAQLRHNPSLLGNPNFWRGHLSESTSVSVSNKLAAMQGFIRRSWQLSDLQTELRLVEDAAISAESFDSLLNNSPVPESNPLMQMPEKQMCIQMQSSRVFLDPPVATAAAKVVTNVQPILTYLATLLRAGTNAAPYSMVTAAGAPWTPATLRDDEIVVSQWLAEDLHVKPGDEIALSYFLPESGARLEEATNKFRVHSVVPMQMPWADRTLMPDFPGIEKAERTSEWDAGFPLTYEIRKKDDDYWKQYRGTPKAFITLAAGQKLWGNRFGNLTAIRFPILTNSPTPQTPDLVLNALFTNAKQPSPADRFRGELEQKILTNLNPEELGLRFEPVREQALKAAAEAQDFGGLFLGFSFFLIIAALLLMALLFQFGLEQRAPEIGTLLALGFTPKQVRRLFLREGTALAFLGGIIGAAGGIYFAKAMLQGLATVWRDAVGAAALNFHVTGQTLVIGVFASVVVSMVTIWLALRKFVKRPARELLVGEIGGGESKSKNLKSKVIGGAALLGGIALVGWATFTGETQNAGIFFGAGAMILVGGLSFVSARLAQMAREEQKHAGQGHTAPITTASLAVRGCARRRKRSLATVAMLACGSFLIVSIGVFRLDANRDATQKKSGTGGFALIGETTLPVMQDLNAAAGRDFFALNEQDLAGVSFVPFRVRAGDEASCLNLNRAQKPRLLGVKPELLGGRFAFAKLVDGGFQEKPWEILKEFYPKYDQPLATNEIPAIGDANSIQWAMGKKVGDTIDYVDERGQSFKVRIVGAVANSILQGQLIIDEAEFVKRFPGEAGHRTFLIDAPSNAVSQVSATLSRAMQDVGLELTATTVRLDQFNAVQNTYLGTFQVLGGLGLLLGSVGLGVVVLRNVLERRSELAVLLAVGFRKAQVQRLLILENGALLLAGLALGILAAAVAVLPAVLAPAGQLPYVSLAITLAAVLGNGALWTWLATRFAVRGDLLAALRND